MQEQEQKEKEKVYRDFHLLALGHLNAYELLNSDGSINEEARKEIKRRIDYGKKSILQNTKEGDLIAFETPEKETFNSFKKIALPGYEKKFKENADRMLLKRWQILRLHWNFYSELAYYAKANGRKVMSLESGLLRPGSKLPQSYNDPKNIEKGARVRYLVERRRDLSYIKKIQQKKPNFVIVSRGHGVLIEFEVHPKKVEYFPQIDITSKIFNYTRIKQLHNDYLKEKKERRARINEELKRKNEVKKIASQINQMESIKKHKRI